MPTLLEVVVSPKTHRLLGRLRDGMLEAQAAALPVRSRQLVARLQRAGLLRPEALTANLTVLRLVPDVRWSAPELHEPDERAVSREDLDHLGLTGVPAFRIASSADRRRGRPRKPGPRVFLRRIPDVLYDPRTNIVETALALIALDPRAAHQFIVAQARPNNEWDGLRRRIREEGLEGRAFYRGIDRLIGLRRRSAVTPPRKTRAVRSDAYRRAKTEPKPRRSR